MERRTFTDTHKALAKGVITNISYKPFFREPADTFRPKVTGSSVGYMLDDIKKGWEDLFGLDEERVLCDWACQGAEFIGDGVVTPQTGRTFDDLRSTFAEWVAEAKDDRDAEGEEWTADDRRDEDMVNEWLGEHVEFWSWLLSWYVEEALVEWARENALDVLNNNVSGSTVQSVTENAYETFCRAWVRWYDQTHQTEGR